MTDYRATSKQWADLEQTSAAWPGAWGPCILELRARVETLEAAAQKHIVETSANMRALFTRVEDLETANRPKSKVYEINEPLQLTPEQAQQITDMLTLNSKPTPNPSQIRSSLVEQVKAAIELEDEKHYWPSPETSAYRQALADIARVAIREVAAWMTSNPDHHFPPALVFALEQEAER